MNIYDKLNVKTYINAYDTMTVYGGSLMTEEVLHAMAEASKHFVDIHDLQKKIGTEIAKMTNNEDAYVTSGGAAGILVAAAACMTGTDRYKVSQLPNTQNMKNEIIIMKCQRNGYDIGIEAAGAKLIEVGKADETLPWQLEGAINDKTAAIIFFPSASLQKGALSFEEIIHIGKTNNVPVIVDAAAQIPPVSRLWEYTKAGAKLVIFSGGKTLKGPQCSGLILGDAEFIEACRLNGNPNHAIGRVSKIGKEEIVGVWTALKRYLSLDHEVEHKKYYNILNNIVSSIQKEDEVTTSIIDRGSAGQNYPRLLITFKEKQIRDYVVDDLMKGEQAVLVGKFADEKSIYISPTNLKDEDSTIVGQKIRESIKNFI